MTTILLAILASLVACVATYVYMLSMAAYGRVEQPSERGLHTTPVPSGSGVVIVLTAMLLWLTTQGFALEATYLLLVAASLALTALSWIDDQCRLTPHFRIVAHTVAVTMLLASLGPDQRALPSIPLNAERVLVGLAWVWFTNLFNFMDGIDGLAGCGAIAITTGYLVVAATAGTGTRCDELALMLGAAVAGYLVWNWYPAKVYMGDAGSIPLGFLLGWLMIDLAFKGYIAAAVILPLYFAADATLTLFRRLRRGEDCWQPHRSHFYQRAVLGGQAPPTVVRRVNVIHILLIGLALLSVRFPVTALAGAAIAVVGFLLHLEGMAGKRTPPPCA